MQTENAPSQELEKQALSWPERARAITIADQASYNAAAELALAVAALKKRIVEHHKPIKDAGYSAWKTSVAAEKRLLDPLEKASEIIRLELTDWEIKQESIRREAERKAMEEARKREEEARLALALEAEKYGADEAAVEEILETPAPIVETVVQPRTFQRAAGVSPRETWHAEVVDMKALARAIVEGQASIELILPNMPALNKLAIALKTTFNIPGVSAKRTTGIMTRGR